MENQETQVVETQQEMQEQIDTSTAEVKDEGTKPEVNESEVKTFTREMVNDIVRSRLEKDRKSFYKRYGVADRNGLDSLIGKSQSYDVMKERYDKIKGDYSALQEKMAFLSNNINPAREDDIRAYFKGKGIEFNDTNLMNELATHPEWLNVKDNDNSPKTTIQSLGTEHTFKRVHESEEERQKRIFGI